MAPCPAHGMDRCGIDRFTLARKMAEGVPGDKIKDLREEIVTKAVFIG